MTDLCSDMRFLRLPAVRSQDNDTAFTIVELLVVVLVIGILAAIAIPTFLGQRHRAQDRSAQSDLRNALMAAKTLVVDHEGDYSKIGDDDDLVEGLRGIEPALDFEVLPIANYATDPDTESVYVTIEGDSFVGVRVSESGRVFCVVDSRDATFLGEADDPANPTDCTPLEGEEADAGETTTTTSTPSTTTTTTVTTLPEEPVGVTSVSAGEHHTCAAIDGKAYCWGGETSRRVSGWTAPATVTEVPAPVEVKVEGTPLEGKLVSKVGAGRYFSCALAEGDVFCWGMPPGTGNGVSGNTAQFVVAVTETWGEAVVTDLEVGAYSACAIAGGELYCWGVDKWGNLGLGTNGNQLSQTTPRRIELPGTVTSVGASSSPNISGSSGFHTCAVAAGDLYCWGHNEYGKLGVGSEVTYSKDPMRVDVDGKEVSSVSAGTQHTCAVAEGDVYCWGRGVRGRIGNGSIADVPYYTPQKVSFFDDKTVVAVDASDQNTCAITSAGELYCWGDYRALGVQGSSDASTPVLIGEGTEMEGKAVSAVTGGYSSTNPHQCAIAENTLFCWGYDTYGKLGNGPGAGFSWYPTPVLSPS